MKYFFFFFSISLNAQSYLKLQRKFSFHIRLHEIMHPAFLRTYFESLLRPAGSSFYAFSYDHPDYGTNQYDPGGFYHSYAGGFYNAYQSRIQFVPFDQVGKDRRHYWDEHLKALDYLDGSATTGYGGADREAFVGAVLDPVNQRVVYVPHSVAQKDFWVYYDLVLDKEVKYSTQLPDEDFSTARSYAGGTYDPLHQRVIFAPYRQANNSLWHYYDCNTSTIGSYANHLSSNPLPNEEKIESQGYWGSVYDPQNQRIVFVPHDVRDKTTWHYYDCRTETVVPYDHGQNASHFPNNGVYKGGVYDPNHEIIVFVPHKGQGRNQLHYYDCRDPQDPIKTYNISNSMRNDLENRRNYSGGAFDPATGFIFFAVAQNHTPIWHYFDPYQMTLVEFPAVDNSYHANNPAYQGAVYSPKNHLILFIPYRQTSREKLHGIQLPYVKTDPLMTMHYLFNQF